MSPLHDHLPLASCSVAQLARSSLCVDEHLYEPVQLLFQDWELKTHDTE